MSLYAHAEARGGRPCLIYSVHAFITHTAYALRSGDSWRGSIFSFYHVASGDVRLGIKHLHLLSYLASPTQLFLGQGRISHCVWGSRYFSRIGGSMSSRAPPFPAPPTDEVMNMCSYSLLLYGFWGLGSSIFPGKQEKFIH